jgi:hypothetical protein
MTSFFPIVSICLTPLIWQFKRSDFGPIFNWDKFWIGKYLYLHVLIAPIVVNRHFWKPLSTSSVRRVLKASTAISTLYSQLQLAISLALENKYSTLSASPRNGAPGPARQRSAGGKGRPRPSAQHCHAHGTRQLSTRTVHWYSSCG